MTISKIFLFVAFAVAATSVLPAQDTVRVRNRSAPQWGANVKLTPALSMGQADGPDEYSFGSLSRIASDRQGRLYLYDSQDKKLRQYDPSGKFLQTIGRAGAGPGEFEEINDLVITEDSIVFIRDGSQARVLFFYPSGKLRGGFTDARFSHVGFPSVTVDNQGLITTHVFSRKEGVSGSDRLRYKHLVRIRANGTVVDSMKFPDALPFDDSKTFSVAGNYNFIPASWYAPLRSGGFVAGDGDALRFMIRAPTGPVRVVERAWTPVPVGREERANWVEFADNLLKRPYRSVGGTNKPRDYKIPAVKPAYNGIFTDDDSRIWISMFAPAHKVDLPPRAAGATGPRLWWRQNDVYEVFSDRGEYLGRVEMPEKVYLVKAQGNRIWTFTTGSGDEAVMRVYTLSGSVPVKR